MMKTNPWAWIPTLYFAEGLPNIIVTALSVCRRCIVCRMALSAVGVEAIMESVYRHPKNQALVDTDNADAHWRCIGWYCLYVANSILVSRHNVLFLLHGFCQCHTRHSRRWLLHADA